MGFLQVPWHLECQAKSLTRSATNVLFLSCDALIRYARHRAAIDARIEKAIALAWSITMPSRRPCDLPGSERASSRSHGFVTALPGYLIERSVDMGELSAEFRAKQSEWRPVVDSFDLGLLLEQAIIIQTTSGDVLRVPHHVSVSVRAGEHALVVLPNQRAASL